MIQDMSVDSLSATTTTTTTTEKINEDQLNG